ncbi:hypothetical protein E2C01_031410 [Portunus trituberculatus]|uniref:Uncharacterized protein n=1 Tax=Portunus trituberculatus TaxID=210409 RepID=A0A5B7EWR1_PORTR|nr:hypothetical protein [Portunus trituberculatus]
MESIKYHTTVRFLQRPATLQRHVAVTCHYLTPLAPVSAPQHLASPIHQALAPSESRSCVCQEHEVAKLS